MALRNSRARRAGRARLHGQGLALPSWCAPEDVKRVTESIPEDLESVFRLVEDRAKWALVATLLEEEIRQGVTRDRAEAVIRSTNKRADAWINDVRIPCRALAVKTRGTTPDAYSEILAQRAALFADLPLPQSRRGRPRKRPALSPREAWRRYREILHARSGGASIEQLAKDWAPGLSRETLISLDRRPDAEVAAYLAGEPYKVSLSEMRRKLLPKARAERFELAVAFARASGESLTRDDFDEDSVANEQGDWVQRRGRWFFRRWIEGPDGKPDLGAPVRVNGPGRIPT